MKQPSEDFAVELDQALAESQREEREEREADLVRQARSAENLAAVLARQHTTDQA